MEVFYEGKGLHTLALHSTPVDARTCNENIMYDGEYTFAAHPPAIPVLDLTIIEHSSLV